jgi:hypothetical protein
VGVGLGREGGIPAHPAIAIRTMGAEFLGSIIALA